MIVLYTDKGNCCGCTACMSVCPKHAISMKTDGEGFLYPAIQESLCIECGLCQKVCSFQNGYDTIQNYDKPFVYAVKHVSDETRYKSSSGGMFTVLSDEVLFQNGVIYGVGFDEKMTVCHQRAMNKAKRDFFCGSKYVQSDMGQTLKHIEMDLREARKVLFTGTPCQVAAVREYLKKRNVETDNLVLCDVICHGTSSPLIFSEYLKLCEKKKGGKIINHVFRSKIKGWHTHTEMNVFSNGQKDYKSFLSQLYKNIFYSHVALRPSCHKCIYTNLRRPSDITIADFWGVDKTYPEFDDNKGISLVLINTEKGKKIFQSVSSHIIFKQSNVTACLQPNMKESSKPSPMRDEFWQDYYANGFDHVIKKYLGYGVKGNIKRFLSILIHKMGLFPVVKKILRM